MKNSQLDSLKKKCLKIKENPSSEGCHPTRVVNWFDRLIIWFAVPMGDKFDLALTGSDLILII